MKEDIRQLLERFYRCELTIDEERRLINLLLSDNCPMDMKAERHAVIILARQEAIEIPANLEEGVLKAIKPHTININRYKWLAAVAIALLLLGTAFWIYQPKPDSLAEPQAIANNGPVIRTVIPSKSTPIPNVKTTSFSASETIAHTSIGDLDTTSTIENTGQELPHAIEKEQAKPEDHKKEPYDSDMEPNKGYVPVILPSDFHDHKNIDNHLTAKVYISSTMADRTAEPNDLNGIPRHFSSDKTNIHHRLPVRLGLSLRYRLNDHWSVESGLSYTHLSSDIPTLLDGKIIMTEQRLNYIGLPLSVSYSLWKNRHLDLYLSTGAMIEKSLNTKPWQFSLNGATGFEYKLADFFSLYVEPGLGYYFKDGSSTPTIYQDHPLNFNLSFGLRFNLKKVRIN